MPSPIELATVVAASTVSGAVNVVAGGGSFLTLSLLLLIGVPAPVANATNRVGVLTQSLAGLWGFHRHGVVDWRWALRVSLPAMAGAGLGAWLALAIPPHAFSRMLATIMLVMTGWSLWRQRASSGSASTAGTPWGPLATNLGFFLMGVYGGFIQAGIGFLLLAFTSAAGFDLVKGNAIKLLHVLLMTIVALAVFGSAGTIDWSMGLALGIGTFIGGSLGVRLAMALGHTWIQRIVTVAMVLFAVLLWFG